VLAVSEKPGDDTFSRHQPWVPTAPARDPIRDPLPANFDGGINQYSPMGDIAVIGALADGLNQPKYRGTTWRIAVYGLAVLATFLVILLLLAL
jgi:hypothetical protein